MAVEKEKNQQEAQSAEQTEPETADFKSELREPVWSVISFDRCEAAGLTYAQAEEKLTALEAQKVSGLCIVADEVAARVAAQNQV